MRNSSGESNKTGARLVKLNEVWGWERQARERVSWVDVLDG